MRSYLQVCDKYLQFIIKQRTRAYWSGIYMRALKQQFTHMYER